MAGERVEVIQPWALLVGGVLLAAAVVVALLVARARRGRADAAALPVAHADRLTGLPGFRRAVGRYRILLSASAVLAVVGIVAATLLTARVARVEVQHTDIANRDIVLCLDVSGSMIDYDSRVVDEFAELARQFEGERLSLVVFNASAVTYFPLTTDLDYIERQFSTLQTEFASPDQSYFDGTLVGNGSSLVGDGLASCALRFDRTAEQRSRSIVLVTDNVVIGTPIYTMTQAGALAASRGIRVYGLNPGDQASKGYLQSTADEFRSAVEATGGAYYALDDPDAVPSIVERVTAQQVAVTSGPSRVVVNDLPALATLLAALALLGVMLLGWRMRR